MSSVYIEYILKKTKIQSMILTCCLSVVLLKMATGLPEESDLTTYPSVIPVGCPSSCYCDGNGEYASCVGDGIYGIPMDIPNTTIRLELRNYLVKYLSSIDLINLSEIEEIKLQQSRIETIENGTFIGNSKLERLDLSQNILTVLTSQVFANLANLRYLDLSSNLLELVEQAFMGLLNLEQLNMRDNALQQLTTNTFFGLHKIQYLNLDANNISSIEVGTFQYLTNLAHLIISNNPLTTLSRLDFFGSRLQFIDISHVGLDRIPQSLTKFVRDLRLAKNNLTHISAGDFDSYPYLGLLVLDDNCVSEIENDALGRQEYLMRLWLNGNCLTRVPPNLPPSLLALYMEENKLQELSGYSFKGLIHLEQLFLQRNEIKYLTSCVFCDLISLKSLDLQANQIENLTYGIFSNLTQLQTLDLSQNNLKYIDHHCFNSLSHLITLQMSRVHTDVQLNDAIFDPLHNLETLEVYDSSILVHTIINSTRMLHGLRNVQELNLMHNRIVKLRSDFPSFFPSMKLIKLSGNLWHCDEHIKWLSNWIKQSNVQFYSSYNIRCATPETVQFKPLMMLTETDFQTTTAISLAEILSTTNMTTLLETSSQSASTREINQPFSDELTSETIPYITTTKMATESKNFASNDSGYLSTHPYEYKIISNKKSVSKTQKSVTDSSEDQKTGHDFTKFSQDISSTTAHTSMHYLTTQYPHTTEVVSTQILEDTKLTINNNSDYESFDVSKISSQQTVSPQRRVLSSRLRVAAHTNNSKDWDTKTTVFVITVGSCACFVFAFLALTFFTCARLRHRYQPVQHRNMRRSSSISYYPQKDEVSIVSLTEGTGCHRTTSHIGLGNKLYYIMENGGSTTDATTEAQPDSQLQELLPQSPSDNTHVY